MSLCSLSGILCALRECITQDLIEEFGEVNEENSHVLTMFFYLSENVFHCDNSISDSSLRTESSLVEKNDF